MDQQSGGMYFTPGEILSECAGEDQTVSDPASSWTPTGRLRWYREIVITPDAPYSFSHPMKLQQEWVNRVSEALPEWRDVPVVVKEQEAE